MKNIIIISIILTLLQAIGFSQIEFNCEIDSVENSEITGGPSCCTKNCRKAFPGTDVDVIPVNGVGNVKINVNVIFVQKSDGSANFTMSNPEHKDIFDQIFVRINNQLQNLIDDPDCGHSKYTDKDCYRTDYISNAHIEFVPHYIEYRNSYYWDHSHDNGHWRNTSPRPPDGKAKKFLQDIVDKAKNEDGFVDGGFNVIYTLNKGYDDWNKDIPLWDPSSGYIFDYGPGIAYSGQASNQWLNADIMMHMPDIYPVYENGILHVHPFGTQWVNQKFIPEQAHALLHEFFHYFLFNTGHRNDCYHNIMNQPGSAPHDALRACQLEQAWNTLMTTNLRNAVQCDDSYIYDIIVKNDMTWDNNVYIYGNVKIINNAKLTVTCKLSFAEQRKINVRTGSQLDVRGATLTSMKDCSYWRGIVADGSSVRTHDVIVREGAVIENAINGVSFMPDLTWPLVSSFGNGAIYSKNASFLNCIRGIEMISFTPANNLSLIENTSFSGISSDAISNWNCQNVDVLNSTFSGIGDNSIHSEGGSFICKDNQFTSSNQDVYFVHNFIGPRSTFIKNTFNGTDGIVSVGGTHGPFIILKNTFNNSNQGTYMDGDALYYISNNDYKSQGWGLLSNATGDEKNLVTFNKFQDNETGIEFINENSSSKFLVNCFNTVLRDVYIDGSVNSEQGNTFDEAGNCFTTTVPDIVGPMEHFIYFLFEDDINCKDPQQLGNYDVLQALNESNPQEKCGRDGFSPNPGEEEYLPPTEAELLTAISTLQSEINGVETDNSLSSIEKQSLLGSKRHQLANLYAQLVEIYLSTGRFEEARTTLPLYNEGDHLKVALYSTYILENNLTAAADFLSSQEEPSEEFQDFITSQEIYLSYLAQGPLAYQLTSADSLLLLQMGAKEFPLAAYSRSVFTTLTGLAFISEVPEFPLEYRNKKKNSKDKAGLDIKISPNPAAQTLSIFNSMDRVIQWDIIDIYGQTKLSGFSNTDKKLIDIRALSNGMYLFNAKDNQTQEILLNQKLVISK